MKAALACSGDVVYSWDLVRDNISWIGNTADMFGISTPDAVLSGDAPSVASTDAKGCTIKWKE